jgi:hypothetical protein
MADRDIRGRFQKGHQLTPNAGRPQNEKYLETRAAVMGILQDEITLDDWRAIVAKQVQQAKNGHWRAVRFLADYTLGAPPEAAPHDADKTIIILGWSNQPQRHEPIIRLEDDTDAASGE